MQDSPTCLQSICKSLIGLHTVRALSAFLSFPAVALATSSALDHVTVLSIGTLWLFNIAMENNPFIDGLPIKNGDFPWLC